MPGRATTEANSQMSEKHTEGSMERITLEEFISDIQEDQSALRDGHELGLIIDESDGGSDRLARTMSAIAEQAPSVLLSIDELLSPSRAKETVSSVNGGDTLVLVHASEPLLPKHYARLQGLVNFHALEEWRNNGTEREIVRFGDGSRFVLVLSRKLFEETLREYPQLRGILGISLSLDDARERGVL